MKTNLFKSWGQFFTLVFILSLFLFTPLQQTQAENERYVSEQIMHVQAKPLDPRAQILQNYLEKYNSPLADHSQDFIEAADKYDVDWRLVPAIAGVESTFGKFIPGGYNAWGWGVYGDQALGFQSWKDGIYTLNKGLRENYINRGYTEPYSMNRIYASSPTWGSKVSFFIADIEKFSQNFDKSKLTVVPSNSREKTKIAGSSATLAF